MHPAPRRGLALNLTVVALAAGCMLSPAAGHAQSPDLKAMWREKARERAAAPAKPVANTSRPHKVEPKPAKPAAAPAHNEAAHKDSVVAKPAADRLALLEQTVANQARLIDSLSSKVAAADSAARHASRPEPVKVAVDTPKAAPAKEPSPVAAAPTPAPKTLPAEVKPSPATSPATPSSKEPAETAAPTAAATPASKGAPAAATPAPTAFEKKVDSLAAASKAIEKQVATMQQTFTQRLAGLGNFRFGGDIRVRGEAFDQSGGFVSRRRERTRARVTLTGSANDDLSGGIAISTGPLDDNQSPNQTNTGFFTRKVVGFDRFYLTYHPHQFKPLTVTAGKFAYPWYRTSLTFGNDIYPEGIAQTLSFNFGKTNPLQNLSVVGFALPLNEVSAGSDGYISGGQLQTKWRLSQKTMARVYATSLTMAHPDQVAAAVVAGTIKPSSVTNSLKTDSTGKVLGYATGFAYQEGIAAVDVALSPKFPFTLQLDVVSNARAQKDNTAWQLDARVGRLSEPKDLQLTWTLFNIERDAVLATFNEQDLRAGTNVRQDRVGLNYQLQKNMTLQFTGWFGHLLDPSLSRSLIPAGARASCSPTNPTSCTDPLLRRLQFDVVYKY